MCHEQPLVPIRGGADLVEERVSYQGDGADIPAYFVRPEGDVTPGVVIVSESALQGHAGAIGEYMGHPIWASVRFMGMDYRFDHVQPANRREYLAPRELFIDPGLVYITQ